MTASLDLRPMDFATWCQYAAIPEYAVAPTWQVFVELTSRTFHLLPNTNPVITMGQFVTFADVLMPELDETYRNVLYGVSVALAKSYPQLMSLRGFEEWAAFVELYESDSRMSSRVWTGLLHSGLNISRGVGREIRKQCRLSELVIRRLLAAGTEEVYQLGQLGDLILKTWVKSFDLARSPLIYGFAEFAEFGRQQGFDIDMTIPIAWQILTEHFDKGGMSLWALRLHPGAVLDVVMRIPSCSICRDLNPLQTTLLRQWALALANHS